MNKLINKWIIFSTASMLLLAGNDLSGETKTSSGSDAAGDSLQLKDIISLVIKNHPSVKSAEEAINGANSRIELAKAGYYPEVDASANYSNIGPVTKLSIPSMGTFQLFPENNYSAAINYRQTVYDFGRTRESIEIEKGNKAIGEQSLEQVKQKLALAAVNNYYTLSFLQAAIKIKDQQLLTLQEHLNHIETMMKTGSATEYQVLSTKVKISTIESQKLDLMAVLHTQQAFLNSLLGLNEDNVPVVKNESFTEAPLVRDDSILVYAFHNRDEILLNEKKRSLAELRYQLIRSQNKPVISFMAAGGAKNGYVPYLEKIKPNYVVGLGIRIPIFDGMKTKYNLSQAESAINSLTYETEFTRRNITSEIKEARAYMTAAEQKINQFELQLEQALKAYSLAETSFRSGTITNLDLIDANTSVSESRLLLLKARIDFAACVYKLKAAAGERIY